MPMVHGLVRSEASGEAMVQTMMTCERIAMVMMSGTSTGGPAQELTSCKHGYIARKKNIVRVLFAIFGLACLPAQGSFARIERQR